jgi:hypothetical protein
MGADHFLGFYGIKIALDPNNEEEQEACGLGTDPRCIRALAAGLQTHTGRMTDGEDYFLYIGRRLTSIGLQAESHTTHTVAGVVAMASDIDPRLVQAGFRERPALHFQLQAQY